MSQLTGELFAQAKRADLHCHSLASNRPAEAMLKVIACPECYSEPGAVYAQAKARGMDFVTITDHDCMAGVLTLANRADVLSGEELTCWFPEDNCKMHVVIWGLSSADHEALAARARNIYDVAEYIEQNQLAHAVAHPIYRQNEKLERWHLERLLLLFKGFEVLNGAHSPLHREAFEPMVDRLDEAETQRLERKHGLRARWPEPWVKARTGGSDDHGLLNIGRTWTEFPAHVATKEEVLACLREGLCRPGGETGSSLKLAHTFYSVAVRYYGRHILPAGAEPNLPAALLQMLVGERPAPGRGDLLRAMAGSTIRKLAADLTPPLLLRALGKDTRQPTIRELFVDAAKKRLLEHRELLESIKEGLPPLGEHERMFDFVSDMNRDVSESIAQLIRQSVDQASFTGLFNGIAAILAQQFVLSPYYFSLFHQNKERRLLRSLTGEGRPIEAETIKVGLFTDTFDEINGVGRFLRDMTRQAELANARLTIHTCCAAPTHRLANRVNFTPLLTWPMPCYEEHLCLTLPPVLEILELADRQQYDAIHVSTPGPMGLCGYLVAKMLRIPLLGTYHTDFPAYLEELSGDHRVARGTQQYMEWFYQRMSRVLSRSREYRATLVGLGIRSDRLGLVPPSVDTEKFNPGKRDDSIWGRIGVREPLRLLYAGRISAEKNLGLLVEAVKQLWGRRRDVALVLAGDGPYRAQMEAAFERFPAYFVGVQGDDSLAALYASADLFVFPSRTDTLGQVVMEAQSSGLPALVSDMGGPREIIADGVTGVILDSSSSCAWSDAIGALLDDPQSRQQMSRAAVGRMRRFSLPETFEAFWQEHVTAIRSDAGLAEPSGTSSQPSSATSV